MKLFDRTKIVYPICFLIGVAVGILATITYYYRDNDSFHFTADRNNDGAIDTDFEYSDGVLRTAKDDRNFDGQWDFFQWYEDDILARAEGDDNFDGRIDLWLEYKNGNLHKSSQDLDWNGKADAETHFEFGIAKFALIQANGETSFSRAEVYRPGGTLLREYRDTTGDGYLDTVLTYDLFGNEESEEKLGTPINPEARWLMERVEFQ